MMDLYVALLHYPVYDKNHRVIATAVTNVDIHDICRMSATYGIKGVFLVTPVEQQRELVGKMLTHWTEGGGATYNPRRKEALELARVVPDLEVVMVDVENRSGVRPVTIGTAARERKTMVTFENMREILSGEQGAAILVLGTGWGLERTFIAALDYNLEPIRGAGEYNHLSVRSAAAIMVDRLLGSEAEIGLK